MKYKYIPLIPKTGSFGQNHSEHGVGLFQTVFLPALHPVAIINAGTLYSGYRFPKGAEVTIQPVGESL